MKRISPIIVISVIMAVHILSGCSSMPTAQDILAINIDDLIDAKDSGISREVPLSYDAAYDKVTDIVRNQNLRIFRESRSRGYIVVINFPKQTNTTRVGIFFETVSNNNTEVTISSLSTTALEKANLMILEKL